MAITFRIADNHSCCFIDHSTSLPNRVQISKATANLLMDAGKAFMLEKRAEEVFIKGKGRLETYFLVNPKENSTVSSSALSVANVQRKPKELRMKEQRLVDWNCKILSDHLKKVVARRVAVKGKMYSRKKDLQFTSADRGGKSCLEELDDVLSIPQFDEKIMTKGADFAKEVELPPEVLSQLKLFVETIASKYLSNPFHNFVSENAMLVW